MKAIWRGAVLADSRKGIVVEGNYYFPPESIATEFFRASDLHTVCSWKGTASYYDLVVDDEVNANAAWYYPAPERAAEQITGYVAFYRDRVDMVED